MNGAQPGRRGTMIHVAVAAPGPKGLPQFCRCEVGLHVFYHPVSALPYMEAGKIRGSAFSAGAAGSFRRAHVAPLSGNLPKASIGLAWFSCWPGPSGMDPEVWRAALNGRTGDEKSLCLHSRGAGSFYATAGSSFRRCGLPRISAPSSPGRSRFCGGHRGGCRRRGRLISGPRAAPPMRRGRGSHGPGALELTRGCGRGRGGHPFPPDRIGPDPFDPLRDRAASLVSASYHPVREDMSPLEGARDCLMGNLRRIGPGFFPVMLGGGDARPGTYASLFERAEPRATRPGEIKALAFRSAGHLSFGLLVRDFGLGAGTVALVLLVTFGQPQRSLIAAGRHPRPGLCLIGYLVSSWGCASRWICLPLTCFPGRG